MGGAVHVGNGIAQGIWVEQYKSAKFGQVGGKVCTGRGRALGKWVHCLNYAQELGIFSTFQRKLMYFSFHFHIKTSSFNGSVFFLQYSQAHRASSFHKYFLSVVPYLTKLKIHCMLKVNLIAPWFNAYTHCTVAHKKSL